MNTRATMASTEAALLRRRTGSHGKVTNIELFFDLVFVYAVTQLSHTLLHDLSMTGALHVLLLFLAVWWVWIFTGWITNWLDPERLAVRIMLLVLTFAGLVQSTALPEAFAEHGLAFAGAYAFMQVGRSAFMTWVLRHASRAARLNFVRITTWFVVAAVFWLMGALYEGQTRFALWVAALAIEYLGPITFFYTPGIGRSSTAEWDVEGGHLAERCSLFVIIALGESVVVTGSSFAESSRDVTAVLAFVIAFLGSVAMWWIYFDLGAERGSRAISASKDPGRTARLAYTYLHLPIVAGIVVSAVGDELGLTHPAQQARGATLAVLIGGPAIYLLGCGLFKQAVNHIRFPLSHLAGMGLLGLLAVLGSQWSTLWMTAATTLVLMLVAGWETVSLRDVREQLEHEGN